MFRTPLEKDIINQLDFAAKNDVCCTLTSDECEKVVSELDYLERVIAKLEAENAALKDKPND